MLDDLRQQTHSTFDEDETLHLSPPRQRRFLGMTPFQTFVIAVLLLAITCALSAVFLMVTGRVVPPFLY